MGQLQSSSANAGKVSPQEISSKFANKCAGQFSGIELWSFKDVFKGRSKVHDGVHYWTEKEFVKFLEIPNEVSESGRILYSMVYYLCTFPFLRPRVPPLAFSQVAPTTLTFENVVKVVVLFTGRYKSILTGDYDFLKLLFCAIAHYEEVVANDLEYKEKRALTDSESLKESIETSEAKDTNFTKNEISFWEQKFKDLTEFSSSTSSRASTSTADTDIDEEMLSIDLDKISSWYDLDLIKTYDNINIDLLRISPTSLYHLFVLLLAVGALEPQDSLSTYADHFKEPNVSKYRSIAKSMTRSFDLKWHLGVLTDQASVLENGISYYNFYKVIKATMPFAFDGLAILFERFLFYQKTTPDVPQNPGSTPIPQVVERASPHPYASPRDHDGLVDHVGNEDEDEEQIKLPSRIPEPTKLMSASTIAQLATFMDTNSFHLYGGLKKLYVGSEAGFSMGSFEQKVFKWNAPTIVLISGYVLSSSPKGASERAFLDQIPSARYKSSQNQIMKHNGMVTYGAVVNSPWKNSHKECFGDNSTALFQLEGVQDVFRATGYNSSYVYFSKSLGIGFGSTPPKLNSHQNNGLPQYLFGDLSLTVEPGLEFGIFRHIGGETYKNSQIREGLDFEDRFAITEFEVWGCGADEVLREQARLWAWEEREALLRKNVNLSKDIEESRALLELAGLIGGGGRRTGGSV
ncbi:TLD-domain-containing protein [Lipomyces japonicus]|uniref:TLD-domain-containing protein n=1 Tax=Lipomyces japonicus TaxID=56871 RepID=UPI0034CD6214